METTLDLPVVADQHAFNQRTLGRSMFDPVFASYEFRVETARFGHAIMMPLPRFSHSAHQSEIAIQLHQLMRGGKVLTECAVSTTEGIKGVDVVWISSGRITKARRKNVLAQAPEICVEVVSPGNTRDEIAEEKHLYFEAGAEEVWLCDVKGRMTFYGRGEPMKIAERSSVCPSFPAVMAE